MRRLVIRSGSHTEQVALPDEQAMFDFAKKFVGWLQGGEVVALSGDLGAGKTTFTKGVATAMGVQGDVTSPTFVLMKVYPVKQNNIKTLVHIDAYRLTSGADLIALGADDYVGKKNAVTFIEWPERVQDILPEDTIWITIEHA